MLGSALLWPGLGFAEDDERAQAFWSEFHATFVSLDQARKLISNLQVIEKGLAELSRWKGLRVDPDFWKVMDKGLGIQKDLLRITTAIGKDVDAIHGQRFVVLHSEVLGAVRDMLLRKGALPKVASYLAERGFTRLAADPKAMPTFGTLDLAGAVFDASIERRLTVDSIDKLADFVVGFVWACLGGVVSLGNPKVMSVYESIGVALAKEGRAQLRGSTLEGTLFVSLPGNVMVPARLIDAYSQYATDQARLGKLPLDWIAYFGGSGGDARERALDTLRSAGIYGERLKALQQISDDYQTTRLPPKTAARAPAAAAPAPAPAPAPGGVDQDMTIDAGRFKPAR